MTDNDSQLAIDPAAHAEIRARADTLEAQLEELRCAMQAKLIRAELKAEAIRSGIIDLDGLKLLEISSARLDEKGEVENAAELVAQLRRAKPWLFNAVSSSSAASAPLAQPPRQKLATEMTDEEYRSARAAFLKQYA